MSQESITDWWKLLMDGRVLTTIANRERAEWFLEKMQPVNPLAKWELVAVGERVRPKPITPTQVKNRKKVEYCTGSD